MKLKYKNLLFAIPCFLFAAWPVFAAGLVPCSGYKCTPCHFLVLVSNIINFMMRDITFPLAGLLFLIGGIMMVAAGASEDNYKKGKTIIVNTLIGVVIVLSAWAIVNTLIVTVGSSAAGIKVENWWTVSCL